MVRFCPKGSSVWSAVFEISHETDRIHQRQRGNQQPFLVSITTDNYRGELWTKLLPHRLQKPSSSENRLISLILLSLCLYSPSPYFLSLSISLFSPAVSLQSRIMHAGVFPASLQRKSWRKDLCNPSKANRNKACSRSSVSED